MTALYKKMLLPCMNKGDRNVRDFSQFKDSYGNHRDELGFFQASC